MCYHSHSSLKQLIGKCVGLTKYIFYTLLAAMCKTKKHMAFYHNISVFTYGLVQISAKTAGGPGSVCLLYIQYIQREAYFIIQYIHHVMLTLITMCYIPHTMTLGALIILYGIWYILYNIVSVYVYLNNAFSVAGLSRIAIGHRRHFRPICLPEPL